MLHTINPSNILSLVNKIFVSKEKENRTIQVAKEGRANYAEKIASSYKPKEMRRFAR